ncbi:unnamed protein product [Adineta steineri]|uniref:Uncharacterized protein n=1 Tax=Adineta steineri TaxID=433720 RepID=A0A813T0U0_9BILA|nr:unnamed protein product [Adineta steineri]CAF0865474.1 unnamed protein product [Adineta steineri]CAF1375054.1 unnamed protein product [Adineta steineri]CAF3912694.1 unnamed protein product [Adineta steineri]CAF3953740.1 unnamed protein product [Adineta steineri]
MNNHGLCKIKEEKNAKFIDILSCSCIDDGIEYLSNNNFQETIDIANACLKFDDQDFATLFINAKHRTVFMIITKLALHLLSNLKLKYLEYDSLYKIGLLTIQIMHNKYIPDAEKEEFYDIFFRYRFQSNNLTECLLQLIQSVTHSTLILIICLWLDIVVHYQHAIRKQRNDLDYSYFEPRKIISECIIKQIYNLPNNLGLRGSFLFYLTYIPYNHINKYIKLASICRQYILSQMKDLNEWTSDTIHCVMGSVCLITKHYSELFKYDEKYYQLLTLIVSCENFHKALLSTWTNDETILIHTIIEYFYENSDDNDEKMMITLGTVIDKLHKLYKNVKDSLIKMNICYLILVSTHKKSQVSDEIILEFFQYIKHQDQTTWNGNIKLRETKKLLQVLRKACHYDSIKDAIIRLDKINELVDLIKSDPDIICDILALLRTKSGAQKILQINHKTSSADNQRPHRDKNKKREPLQSMLKDSSDDDAWIPDTESSRSLVFFSSVKNEVILSCGNTELARHVIRHLEKVHYNIVILNQCNNDMEKENLILTCKCMIVCLTDDYTEYQSELIVAYKNQVKIIPIVTENEKKYCPNEPFLKFILEKYSLSVIRKNINELNDSSADEIRDIHSTQTQTLFDSFEADNNSNDQILQSVTYTAEDLYKACKENDINEVKEYLQNIHIKILNERVGNRSTPLHIASYNGHNEIVQLLLKAGASRSIRNRPYGLTAYEEARTQSTKDLFRMNLDDNQQERFFSNTVFIEWVTTSRNPHKKRNYLRKKLKQLQTYRDYEIDQVYKELVEHMYAYIDTLTLSNHIKQILKQYFTQMKETRSPVYIIKVYTSATSFHKYYNEYIAQHGIDFFDPFSVDIHVDYAIIKSLLKTIGIIMYDKRFSKYRYCGKTYRGMLLTEEDLYKYIVHSKIMNKSFLSTSKSKEIAEAFSGYEQEKFLRKTPDKQAIHISVLCTYIIRNPETALNIETISERISDEKEVLILPFSIFEVKSVQKSSTNTVQIELEEASDELLDNYY